MKNLVLMLLLLSGCSGCHQSYYDGGYDYEGKTQLGIMYRHDNSDFTVDPDLIDYFYSLTTDCVGETYDPNKILIVITTDDVNPNSEGITAGYTYWNTDPRVILLNVDKKQTRAYSLMNS